MVLAHPVTGNNLQSFWNSLMSQLNSDNGAFSRLGQYLSSKDMKAYSDKLKDAILGIDLTNPSEALLVGTIVLGGSSWYMLSKKAEQRAEEAKINAKVEQELRARLDAKMFAEQGQLANSWTSGALPTGSSFSPSQVMGCVFNLLNLTKPSSWVGCSQIYMFILANLSVLYMNKDAIVSLVQSLGPKYISAFMKGDFSQIDPADIAKVQGAFQKAAGKVVPAPPTPAGWFSRR